MNDVFCAESKTDCRIMILGLKLYNRVINAVLDTSKKTFITELRTTLFSKKTMKVGENVFSSSKFRHFDCCMKIDHSCSVFFPNKFVRYVCFIFVDIPRDIPYIDLIKIMKRAEFHCATTLPKIRTENSLNFRLYFICKTISKIRHGCIDWKMKIPYLNWIYVQHHAHVHSMNV